MKKATLVQQQPTTGCRPPKSRRRQSTRRRVSARCIRRAMASCCLGSCPRSGRGAPCRRRRHRSDQSRGNGSLTCGRWRSPWQPQILPRHLVKMMFFGKMDALPSRECDVFFMFFRAICANLPRPDQTGRPRWREDGRLVHLCWPPQPGQQGTRSPPGGRGYTWSVVDSRPLVFHDGCPTTAADCGSRICTYKWASGCCTMI